MSKTTKNPASKPGPEAYTYARLLRLSVAQILCDRMLEIGMTDQELADKTGVPRSHVLDVLLALGDPSTRRIADLCHALGIRIRCVASNAEEPRNPVAQGRRGVR